MIKKFRVFALFALLCYSPTGKAQQNDFATWNYCNLTYKLSENLNCTLSEQMLRNENASETWLYIHDLSFNQWLTKHLSHELHVRLVNQKQLNDAFEERALMYYAVNAHGKVGNYQWGARSRWQGMAYGSHFNDAYRGPYYYHRLRVSLGRSLNYYWRWSLNTEFFQPLNRPNRKGIDQIRYGLTITNTLNKRFSMDHFFQIQQQMQRANPYTYFVYGIGCNFVW